MAATAGRVVWLTGFEPFAGYRTNPSGLIARALDGQRIGGAVIRGRVLPVSLSRSPRALDRLAKLPPPAAIVALGLDGGGSAIRLERVAANRIDFGVAADNDGLVPAPRPIDEGDEAALWATLPIDAIRAACIAQGIPTMVSMTAGTYLCNLILYRLLQRAATLPGQPPCGFIHLPFTPDEAARLQLRTGGLAPQSMTLDMQRQAVAIALHTILVPSHRKHRAVVL